MQKGKNGAVSHNHRQCRTQLVDRYRIPIIILPAAVEESMPSVTDTNVMPRSVIAFTVSRMDVVRRSRSMPSVAISVVVNCRRSPRQQTVRSRWFVSSR